MVPPLFFIFFGDEYLLVTRLHVATVAWLDLAERLRAVRRTDIPLPWARSPATREIPSEKLHVHPVPSNLNSPAVRSSRFCVLHTCCFFFFFFSQCQDSRDLLIKIGQNDLALRLQRATEYGEYLVTRHSRSNIRRGSFQKARWARAFSSSRHCNQIQFSGNIQFQIKRCCQIYAGASSRLGLVFRAHANETV